MTVDGDPRRLTAGPGGVRDTGSNRILSKDQCATLVKRILSFAQGTEETQVTISSWWQGELRWALDSVDLGSDRRDLQIAITRTVNGTQGAVATNQTDDGSLEDAVRAAEFRATLADHGDRIPPYIPSVPILPRPKTAIWSDATYDETTEARGALARAMIAPAEAKGMLSAGYIEVRGASRMSVTSERPDGPYPPWDQPYVEFTQAQVSTTVRDPQGTGSGWAGLSSDDWHAIDGAKLGELALEKCIASRNPVAIEPGRYTVILEAQAVADLIQPMIRTLGLSQRRSNAEQRPGTGNPWAYAFDQAAHVWRSKLGLKVVDGRITISHDPSDPQLGILPVPGMAPATWIRNGVLTDIGYARWYALDKLNANDPLRGPTGYRMSGGPTSVEEMIRTTERGLVVTRFWDVNVLLTDGSLLSGGMTRDGLWLVEHGKITKAVKNFRFTESPLFVLNSVEQLGPPQPVFRPTGTWGGLTSAIVPPLKARDFSFTSLVEAV
ncbi:MAG: metallopeptidase TldD-related protein [Gemmatimonadaceae bacterium]